MSESLSAQDLRLLVERVFQPTEADTGLAIIVDLPDERLADNPDWAGRRQMAADWYNKLVSEQDNLGFDRITGRLIDVSQHYLAAAAHYHSGRGCTQAGNSASYHKYAILYLHLKFSTLYYEYVL